LSFLSLNKPHQEFYSGWFWRARRRWRRNRKRSEYS